MGPIAQIFFAESSTLPQTNSLPLTKWWLGDKPFLLGFGLFSGAFAISFREDNWNGPDIFSGGGTHLLVTFLKKKHPSYQNESIAGIGNPLEPSKIERLKEVLDVE